MQSDRYVSLGGGLRVPYPEPTSEAASKIGKANRRTGTSAERHLRSALHRAGFRFRKDLPVLAGRRRTRPDIVFTRWKVAVFCDGCFWHGCPEHGTSPRANAAYWAPKLAANKARDERTNDQLAQAGWLVVRVWEHEPVEDAVRAVEDALERAGYRRRARPDVCDGAAVSR